MVDSTAVNTVNFVLAKIIFYSLEKQSKLRAQTA